MNDDSLMATQRRLRQRLLDTASVIDWRPARDLAAHLLLHLDAPADCWRLAADWLREAFDADRVDCGFGRPEAAWYRPQAQALRGDRDVPSVLGHAFEAGDGGVQAAWHAAGAVVLRDVSQARLLSHRERAVLLGFGTRIKMAAPITELGSGPVGLVCLDWLDPHARDLEQSWSRFELVARDVLGPVMGAAERLHRPLLGIAVDAAAVSVAEPGSGVGADPGGVLLGRLTPAELAVVRLAVDGLSYKEIARRLDRSFSTIDHQLRSARGKLGASSTARLVHLVSGLPRH